MSEASTQNANPGTYIVYDGECPFCSSYVEFVRLKDAVGPVALINAREGGALVKDITDRGYDLDEGMVLVYKGQYYHGAKCMHMIALLSQPATLFNRFNMFIARSEKLMDFLYPILRAGRNATLRLLGRSKLRNS